MSENEQQAKPFITSVRIEHKGTHDHVSVWTRGGHSGTLVVKQGDGHMLANLLNPSEQVCVPGPRELCNQAGEPIDTAAEVPGPSMPDAEAAAWRELTRRGLDLDAMNRGRARADMPALTAVQTLERIDAAAGALNDLRGLGFPPDLKVDPVEAARRIKRAVHAEADRDAGVDTSHLDGPSALKAATERAVAMGLINPDALDAAVAGASVTRDGDTVHVSIPAPVPSREQLQERLAQIRRLAAHHAERDAIDLRDRAHFAQLVVDLCDADQLIGSELAKLQTENTRLTRLARGAPGWRRSHYRLSGKIGEAHALFRKVLGGAVKTTLADEIQDWLISPFPKKWPPPDLDELDSDVPELVLRADYIPAGTVGDARLNGPFPPALRMLSEDIPERLPPMVRLRYRVREADRAAADADMPLMIDKLTELGAVQVVLEEVRDCPCGDWSLVGASRPEHTARWCDDGERIFETGHR